MSNSHRCSTNFHMIKSSDTLIGSCKINEHWNYQRTLSQTINRQYTARNAFSLFGEEVVACISRLKLNFLNKINIIQVGLNRWTGRLQKSLIDETVLLIHVHSKIHFTKYSQQINNNKKHLTKIRNINTNQYSSLFIHLAMTAQCQPDVYTEHKRCYLTSNTSAENFFFQYTEYLQCCDS